MQCSFSPPTALTKDNENTRPTNSQKSVSFFSGNHSGERWKAPRLCLGFEAKSRAKKELCSANLGGTRGIPSSSLYLRPKVRCPPSPRLDHCTVPPIAQHSRRFHPPAHFLVFAFPDALLQSRTFLSQMSSNFWCFPWFLCSTTPSPHN